MSPRVASFLLALALALTPSVARAQSREAVLVFKDGYHVKGNVVEKRDFIFDPASGTSLTIPDAKGFLYVDDMVRRIHFSPSQVQEVIPIKTGGFKDLMVLKRAGSTLRTGKFLPTWSVENVSDWNSKWEQTYSVRTERGRFDMTRRLFLATPQFIHGMSVGYDWDFAFSPKELGPGVMKLLLQAYYANPNQKDVKDLKDHEKRRNIATFFQQAGWYDEAEKELLELVQDMPDQKEPLKEQLEQLRQLRGNLFAEDIDRLFKVGQHAKAQEFLAAYFQQSLDKVVDSKNQLLVQDIKAKYELLNRQLHDARLALKELTGRVTSRDPWALAARVIVEELNLDTVPRLETFLAFAGPHLRELRENRTPAQPTEEVLALAVTGWLQGNTAAEPDVKAADRLFRTRQFVLDYLSADSPLTRGQTLSSYRKRFDVSHDVVLRLIRLMPPVRAYEGKLDTEPKKLTVEVPDADNTPYHVQLPPDYHHHRPYPVLVALHSARDPIPDLLKRWGPWAGKYGYILVAPQWGQGLKPSYDYTPAQHAAVLDTLRDLRRKFNVDSDRVFLTGWEDGGSAAYDIGLSHPDQFAGVMPMSGSPIGFPQRYASNAQYLPFYAVEGDRNGRFREATKLLFKDWVRSHYPSLYIEYKGRASEWYFAEMPEMMAWMNGKRRHHPAKEMGRYHTGGGTGEEFKTMRESDNRFYWLSAGEIHERHLNDHLNWAPRTLPATLQANLTIGNEPDIKSGARVWNQFNLRVNGMKRVTLWISPTMMDFGKPVMVRVNGQQVGSQRLLQPSLETMMEELYASGDRQRVFVAKIELKL